MPASLIARFALCLTIATPAVVMGIIDFHGNAVVDLFIFGSAVVAAAFLLAWAAEAAHKDISGPLAIAILALIAVLPEYAVDLFYAFRSGSDVEYLQFAAANMTGSNRLLLGLGWPLVALVGLLATRNHLGRQRRRGFLSLPQGSRTDIGFLLVLCVVAFAIPAMRGIPLWFGLILIAVFIAYLWRAGQAPVGDDEEFVGAAALIANLPRRTRRVTITVVFILAAGIIVIAAEPFAESLVNAGTQLGLDSYFLVQWLAPLASEAPEFIVATLFAIRGKGAAAISTLIASKVNQWSLLVGSLPIAHWLGGGDTTLVLDNRQVEEFVLTATQALLGVSIIIALRFNWWAALGLFALFAAQFVITDTGGRYILSAIQLGLALVLLLVHHWQIVPTLRAIVHAPTAATLPAEVSRQPATVG